jgi:ATPase family associated with various cellular activities (AAA)
VTPTGGTTWRKVHDAYLETLLHLVQLTTQRQLDRRRGTGGDATAPEPAPAIEAHRRRLGELDGELEALGAPAAVTVLGRALGLGDVEAEAVMLALAAELDPGAGPRFAAVHDDPRMVSATSGLVAALFDHPVTEVAGLQLSTSPVQRFRIFVPGDERVPASRRPLRLDARLVDYLCGHNRPDERLAGLVEPLADIPLPASQRDLTSRIMGWLTAPDSAATPRVNLVGPPGQGREAVAAALARALGLHPLRLHTERMAGRAERLELARLVEREAALLPALIYVDAPETVGGEATLEGAARELLDTLGGVLVVGSCDPWDPAADLLPIAVPVPSAAERTELWAQAIGGSAGRLDLDGLVEQFPLGPDGVRRAVARAQATADLATGAPRALTDDDLWRACRAVVGSELGQLAQRLRPAAGWGQLVLPEDETALLRQVATQVGQRARVYEQWGFGERLVRGRGISALFTGPPGTGKTMAAEIIAAELDLDLYRVDLSAVVSKYIGETEKNLRRIFDAADQGGAILFFDEADALFGKRTEVRDSHDRHANVEINYLLQRMEDYAGLAILATNRKGDLDPAFLRRIRFLVAFPFPKAPYRRRIWATVFPPQTPRAGLDLDALARLEIAGGNIRNIAVNAAFAAAAADQPVGMGHLMRSAAHEYRKLDRLPSAGEFGRYAGADR